MAARAIWKGVIEFADIHVPVKLYSAVEDRAVHFRLLHDEDHVPVRQRMINPVTGEEADREQIRRGAQVGPDRLVLVHEEELAALEPQPSRTIEVMRFIPPPLLNHAWYVRPYYLGPDGSDENYWALVEALERQKREGLARWVMRKKQYLGALRVDDGNLMMVTLHHAEEVAPAADVKPEPGRPAAERELRMARQLVEALEDEFRPQEYHDEYRQRVMELIERKADGQPLKIRPTEPVRPREGSLAKVLEASLKQVKERGDGKAA